MKQSNLTYVLDILSLVTLSLFGSPGLLNMGIQTIRLAKVIPLFKKGCSMTASNYRPISLLSIIKKIAKILMYMRLYNFLEIHNIFMPLNVVFVQGQSVNHALITMKESIKHSLDNNKFDYGIFLDLQTAFRVVNHQTLLDKLEHYGIRGTALAWNSNQLNVTFGIHQGPVLGPLLSLIYINDLPHISCKSSFYLFVDDTNIYIESHSVGNLSKVVNKELRKRLDANKFALNIDKTNFVIFH